MSEPEIILFVAGRRFYCECGCSVFIKLSDEELDGQFECNGCGVMYA